MSASTIDAMWAEALRKYKETAKKDLASLKCPQSADDLIKQVEDANKDYKHFREKSRKVFKALSAIAAPITTIGNLASGAASRAFPPSAMIFGAAMYLVEAAKGVSAILDAVSDLLWHVQDYTVRLKIYKKAEVSDELQAKLTEILVVVVQILAESTRKANDPSFRYKAYFKSVAFGKDTDMQDLLVKLDQLTKSEGLLVGAETHFLTRQTGQGVELIQDSMTAMQLTQAESTRGIAAIQDRLNEVHAHTTQTRDSEIAKRLKHMLNPSGLSLARLEQISRERRLLPKSGDWLIAEDAFLNWTLGCGQPILWIFGNAGSGKSFLTYNIITYLRPQTGKTNRMASEEICVAYFFLRDDDEVTQSFGRAFCDMAHQLAQQDSDYADYLDAASQNLSGFTSISLAWRILFKDYWIDGQTSKHAYIILDGLDEADPKGRADFFQLLHDIESLGATSQLHVAMLGRPHILSDIEIAGLKEPSAIQVNSTKNSADIALFVTTSIENSQAIGQLSPGLRIKIKDKLIRDAGGMFMWVKLMLGVLNMKARRSRESEVERSLDEAPRELTKMIAHVLEGLSSSLQENEAHDLNTMIMWVSLARRPLFLGELDAALRLRVATGEGVPSLENMLRKDYASLFTLNRKDGLTTSNMIDLKHAYDYSPNGWTSKVYEQVGFSDSGFATAFDSDPKTTTVSFSHTSISDFFSHPKRTPIALPDSPLIGIDSIEARAEVAGLCIAMLTHEDLRARMTPATSLAPYACQYWFTHLQAVEYDRIAEWRRMSIGPDLARLLHDQRYILLWVHKFGTVDLGSDGPRNAEVLLRWFSNPVLRDLWDAEHELLDWIESMYGGPAVQVFQPAVQALAKAWIDDTSRLPQWTAGAICNVVHAWTSIMQGEPYDRTARLNVEDIMVAANFAGNSNTAAFHEGLAKALFEFDHYDEAALAIERSLDLDPTAWTARLQSAQILHAQASLLIGSLRGLNSTAWTAQLHAQLVQGQETHRKAFEQYQAICKQAENDQLSNAILHEIYQSLAVCYEEHQTKGTGSIATTRLDLELKAAEYRAKAYMANHHDHHSLIKSIEGWIDAAECEFGSARAVSNGDPTPSPEYCWQKIIDLIEYAQERSEQSFKNEHEDAVHWLWCSVPADDEFLSVEYLIEAAEKTEQMKFLQSCYEHGISTARETARPCIAARLTLDLAFHIYSQNTKEYEKAVQWAETILQLKPNNVEDEGGLVGARMQAHRMIARTCFDQARAESTRSDYWISILEHAWERSQKTTSLEHVWTRSLKDTFTVDASTSSQLAIWLATWYSLDGANQKAHITVREAIRESLPAVGVGRTPTEMLSWALLAARADKDVIGLLQTNREYWNGLAVLYADFIDPTAIDVQDDDQGALLDDAGATPVTTTGSDSAGSAHDDSFALDCAGPCDARYDAYDDSYICRSCFASLCAKCFARLQKESIPGLKCSSTHKFLHIPGLKTTFREDEIVIDGETMSREEWKQRLRKQWDL